MPILYQDDLLSIETGVDICNPTEELEIITTHMARYLYNSIKIKVNSSEAHFIQFLKIVNYVIGQNILQVTDLLVFVCIIN